MFKPNYRIAAAGMVLLLGMDCSRPNRPASTHAPTAGFILRPYEARSVTGGNDLAALQRLASGVGWETNPNGETTARLKEIGIRTIRCVNVDFISGRYTPKGEFQISNAGYLDAHLKTCRALGANPHVVIAVATLPFFTDPPSPGPRARDGAKIDWKRFRAFCAAIFQYVLVTKRFPDARFEVGNEPDINGPFVSNPKTAPQGSPALYDAYLTLYRNVSDSARAFERSHPTLKVRVGGPAIGWAYSYTHGDFNWIVRFLGDCRRERLKLDFIGVHYYGNESSLRGEYRAAYPPFTAMLKTLKDARAQYQPGIPIWMTEWGPDYHTDNEAQAEVNANHVGAAWDAEFLNAMLEGGITGALYLVTTDYPLREKGKWVDGWGWPSLFVNPLVYGRAYPKAPYHVFWMISRLKGSRVAATQVGGSGIHCLPFADPAHRKIRLLLWNYRHRIPEFGVGEERGQTESVHFILRDARRFFGGKRVHFSESRINSEVGNAFARLRRGIKPDGRAELQTTTATLAFSKPEFDFNVAMPPSSVYMVELSPGN